ncbi:MAG: MaoC family dehydratase N-terminal domain-containing protein [Actinomycetota bacterium]
MAVANTLDESTIGALQARVGIPRRSKGGPGHIDVVTSDSFRHFARAYGDDNPLYSDPAHAAASVWSGSIGPPLFVAIAGRSAPVAWTDEQTAAMAGGDPLAGMGQVLCGDRWILLRPIRPGAEIRRTQCLDAAELRSSTFGGGAGALVSHRVEMRVDGELVGLRFLDFWHTERSGSREAGVNRTVARAPYSAADLAELDRLYESETVRGRTPRTIDGVEVGEQLGPIAKGPLTLTEMFGYQGVIGFGSLGGGASKLAYKNRRRVPKLYDTNSLGIPDTAQRCHWDAEGAQDLGHPAPYDYGQMRASWMVHLLTNWMGDGGWLWRLSTSIEKFNYVGDSHRISGRVTATRPDRNQVDVEVEGTNQRGEITCRATATVVLPARPDEPAAAPEFRDEHVPEPIGPR